MPIIIDRRDFKNPVGELRSPIIPPAVRALKFAPDFSACAPGDLILSTDMESSLARISIVRSQQQAGFTPENSQWTHAAVFLYETIVAEAVPRHGVRLRNLYDDLPNKIMKVRRPIGLNREERLNVALRATAGLGTRYSYRAVIDLALRMRRGLWSPSTLVAYGRGVICSKVYYDALLDVTQTRLPDCPLNGTVTPAHLSATSGMNDIDIPILSIP